VRNFKHQHQRPKKSSLVIGRKAVIEAMQTGKQLERIYMQTTVHGEVIDEIKKLAELNLCPSIKCLLKNSIILT
jgi:23S rRNA (guanosine2251-2'-O)-methyltransferase